MAFHLKGLCNGHGDDDALLIRVQRAGVDHGPLQPGIKAEFPGRRLPPPVVVGIDRALRVHESKAAQAEQGDDLALIRPQGRQVLSAIRRHAAHGDTDLFDVVVEVGGHHLSAAVRQLVQVKTADLTDGFLCVVARAVAHPHGAQHQQEDHKNAACDAHGDHADLWLVMQKYHPFTGKRSGSAGTEPCRRMEMEIL